MLFITNLGKIKEIKRNKYLRDHEYYEQVHEVILNKTMPKQQFAYIVNNVLEENSHRINEKLYTKQN